jgi:hypothetical protein
MDSATTRDGLLALLTERYEANREQFVTLPKAVLDSSTTRLALSELRNTGYIEEQTRGVVRMTPVGYMLCKKDEKASRVKPALQFAV